MSEGEYDIFGEFDKSIHSDDSYSMKQGKTSDAEDKSNLDKEGKKEPVKTRKVTRNPQLKLDPNRLCGQRGIVEVASNFKNVRLQGKGHEKADLDLILSKMEHWAHRLFPKLPFDDCVEQIAKLGGNRIVQVHMKKFRDETDETPEEEQMNEIQEAEDVTLFDKIYETVNDESAISRHYTSLASEESFITQEQQNRMLENKRRAEERRKSRLMMNTMSTSSTANSQNKLCDHASENSSSLDIIEQDSSKSNKTDLTANSDHANDDDLIGIDDFIDNLPDS